MFKVENLSVSYEKDGSSFSVLNSLSLSIPKGEFFINFTSLNKCVHLSLTSHLNEKFFNSYY